MAGALRQALGRTARLAEPPALTCAGRTDAGVHARGQVVHVDLPPIPFDGVGLARALNRQLAPSIVVLAATAVPDDFDARRSATARRLPLPGLERARRPIRCWHPMAWHVRDPLDLRAMAAASDVLLGTHDFRSFCRRKPGTSPDEPIMRRVTRARWSVDEGPEVADAGPRGALLRFEIEANSFCHQMVRSLVGSLVEVGRGQGNAATLLGAPAGRQPPPGRRSGPGPGALPGLGALRLRRAPSRPQPAAGRTQPGGLPARPGRPILVRRPTGPPRA